MLPSPTYTTVASDGAWTLMPGRNRVISSGQSVCVVRHGHLATLPTPRDVEAMEPDLRARTGLLAADAPTAAENRDAAYSTRLETRRRSV